MFIFKYFLSGKFYTHKDTDGIWTWKSFWVQKNFGSKKILGPNNFGSKKIYVDKIWVNKFLGPKNIWKSFGSKKIWVRKNFGSEKILVKKNNV